MVKSELLTHFGVNHGFFGAELTKGSLNIFDSCHEIEDFSKKIGVNYTIFLNQVHSKKISHLNSVKKSDGIIIQKPNIAIALKTADCVPLLLFDDVTKTIGAIHAGARGVYRKVVEAGIKEFLKFRPQNLYAVIGPSVAKESYEVQPDFMRLFPKKYFENVDGKYYFDLKKVVKEKIMFFKGDTMKLEVEDLQIDTFKDTHFHSYRRENKTPLRNISYIAL